MIKVERSSGFHIGKNKSTSCKIKTVFVSKPDSVQVAHGSIDGMLSIFIKEAKVDYLSN